MKTITYKHEEPASTWIETRYLCERCPAHLEHSEKDEEELAHHIAQEHCVVERAKIGNEEWLRFETEVDFNCYKEGDGGRSGYNPDPTHGSWVAPGWYLESYESGPCARGCCSREWYQLTSQGAVEDRLLEEARERFRRVRTLRRCLPTPQ